MAGDSGRSVTLDQFFEIGAAGRLLAGGRPLVPSGPPAPKRAGVQPVAPSRVGLSNSLVHGREFRIYTPKDQSDRSVFLDYIL